MKLVEDQLLQLVGGFALFCVDAGLREQGLGVDTGLLQQQPEAVVLGGQRFLDLRLRERIRDRRLGEGVGNDLQRARAYHISQFGNHLLHLQRLAEETAVGRLIRIG